MTTEYLLDEQVNRVLGCLMPANRLVLEVMLDTGLRVSDVLRLKKSDLTHGNGRFWTTEKKTGKRKYIHLSHSLYARLLHICGHYWVFEGRQGPAYHRTRQAVYQDLKRAAKAYRLPQNIGTHSMRKVYAVKLLDKYGDIEKVRRALNHSSLAVTYIYAAADSLMQQPRRRRTGQRRRNRV